MNRKELSQEELKRKALAKEKREGRVLESRLQSECVIWFKNEYPELGRRLFAVFNEGRDVSHKLSVGLTPGVCDLLYVGESGKLYGFEMKHPDMTHSVQHLITQAKWMMEVLPGRAWFCDSLESFRKGMVGDASGLLDPADVYEYCITCKKKSVLWQTVSTCLRG